ncbi:CoA-binding protein [candidate division TA06 bacterium]|nr:CoA-binding protein [candidate division TA06 bacterium]
MITDNLIREIFEKYRTIAVYGMSRFEHKPSHRVPAYLLSKGFKIIPVNPFTNQILGRKSYPNLKDIEDKIDILEGFRPSDQVLGIVQEDLERKKERGDIAVIWLQVPSVSVTEVVFPWSVIQEGKGRNAQGITEMSKSQVVDPASFGRVENPSSIRSSSFVARKGYGGGTVPTLSGSTKGYFSHRHPWPFIHHLAHLHFLLQRIIIQGLTHGTVKG